jgi:diguanylate cyclase (GGDEF)-like protein
VDRFKAINGSLGHDAGDRLLRALCERLARCLRAADTLARVGVDEFAILLEDVTERSVAELVARKIRAAMAEPFDLDGTRAHIQASMGIAFFPDNATDAEA